MERTKKHKVTTFLHAEVGVLENDIILEVGRVVKVHETLVFKLHSKIILLKTILQTRF